MLAFPAGHMVAATVLFDRRVALRALFRIGRNPVCGLRIILAFLQPHFDKGARRWLMVGQGTSKTEAMFASTGNCRDDPKKISFLNPTFDCILAIWRWTPFEVLFVVHIGSCQQDLISMNAVSCIP